MPVLYKHVSAGIGIVISCASLYLAVPRFISSLYALYPNTAYNQSETKIPLNILESCITDLTDAISWQKDSAYFKKIGVFKLKNAELISIKLQVFREPILREAQKAFINALTISPVDPIAWYQLAYVDSLLNEPIDKIINDLRLSYYAGRVEPDYTMDRIKLSYRYYYNLPEDMITIFNQQINLAWQFNLPWQIDFNELIQFYVDNNEFKKLTDNAINLSPDENIKFHQQIDRYLKTHKK